MNNEVVQQVLVLATIQTISHTIFKIKLSSVKQGLSHTPLTGHVMGKCFVLGSLFVCFMDRSVGVEFCQVFFCFQCFEDHRPGGTCQ